VYGVLYRARAALNLSQGQAQYLISVAVTNYCPNVLPQPLPWSPQPWVTIKQAAEYYRLDPKTIRRMIAHGKLKARRVVVRGVHVDREPLMALGRVKNWGT
jgi:excisionase family DNA binding protein